MMKVVVRLLSAHVAHLDHTSGGTLDSVAELLEGSVASKQDFVDTAQVLLQILSDLSVVSAETLCVHVQGGAGRSAVEGGTAQLDVARLVVQGVFVCISRMACVWPCCLAHSSLLHAAAPAEEGHGGLGGLGGVVLQYISAFVVDGRGSGEEDSEIVPGRWGESWSSNSLGAALLAMKCVLASHLLASDHVVDDLFLAVSRVYTQLALRLCAHIPSSPHTPQGQPASDLLFRNLQQLCGGGIGVNGGVKVCVQWQYAELCKGVGGLGLLLTAVVKGADDPPAAWLLSVLPAVQGLLIVYAGVYTWLWVRVFVWVGRRVCMYFMTLCMCVRTCICIYEYIHIHIYIYIYISIYTYSIYICI